MVQEFGGEARFVVENYGDSELAKRFGVERYPAIFVDDVLVATPKDFGFHGTGDGEGEGRYAPIRKADGQERFRADLTRMVRLILAGRKEAARAVASPAKDEGIAAFPAVTLTGLDGKPLSRADLAGRVALVEFWATWCPPCPASLHWLGELKKRYGDRIAVVAIAVDSDEIDVRRRIERVGAPFFWAMGKPEQVRAFGGVSAVPMLLVFDREGHTAASFYGAPPTLHAEAEAKLQTLLGEKAAR